MTKHLRKLIVQAGITVLDKTILNIIIWLFFISSLLTYIFLDKEKLIFYVITFAVNQFFLFIIFGTGILAIVNLYAIKRIPSIIDEILIRYKRNFWVRDAHIYKVLYKWQSSLKQKPIGFNSIGKEILIREFLLSEIQYFEYNLVILMECMLSDFSDDKCKTSYSICDEFRQIFITNRVAFTTRYDEKFANRITIDPHINLPRGKRKNILRVIPSIILQKFLNSSSNFNIFLDNCISQVQNENMNRYKTLQALFSDFVKCIYSYKDNLLHNFREEFNGDLNQYHLMFDNCRLSPEEKGICHAPEDFTTI